MATGIWFGVTGLILMLALLDLGSSGRVLFADCVAMFSGPPLALGLAGMMLGKAFMRDIAAKKFPLMIQWSLAVPIAAAPLFFVFAALAETLLAPYSSQTLAFDRIAFAAFCSLIFIFPAVFIAVIANAMLFLAVRMRSSA